MFWRATPDGVTVAVKVQPKARRPGLQGAAATADGPRLRIAVSEPPEDGRANRAACVALAEALRVAASAVRVTAGAGAARSCCSSPAIRPCSGPGWPRCEAAWGRALSPRGAMTNARVTSP